MIRVACALIIKDGLLLITRRAPGRSLEGFWEFPGGKLENAEDPKACIVREIKEELGVLIDPEKELNHHFYSDGSLDILLIPFLSSIINGMPTLSVHDQLKWIDPVDWTSYNFSPADIPVIISYLDQRNRGLL